MQTFTIIRRVDAFVNYEVQVIADNASHAATLAREQADALDWQVVSTSTFDARSFVALDDNGEEIEATEQGDF